MISDHPFKVEFSDKSSVFRLGARKQSAQSNNHPGCLNQTREALLSVYFPCIALHFLFNFMAKWTSLTSCTPPLSTPTPLSFPLHPRSSSPPPWPSVPLIITTTWKLFRPLKVALLSQIWHLRVNLLSWIRTTAIHDTPRIVNINTCAN